MKKLKAWLNRQQAKLAAFVAAIGVSLGVIHGVPAQTVSDVITWTNPTKYDDGSTIAAVDMKETRIQWGTSASGPFDGGQTVVAWPGTSATFSRIGSGIGTRCYILVAVSKLGSGVESVPSSPPACKTIDPPPPKPLPPTNVTVK